MNDSAIFWKIPETGLIRHGWWFLISHANIKSRHVLAFLNHVTRSRNWSQILITNLITKCDHFDHKVWSNWSQSVIKLITKCDQNDHKMWSNLWSRWPIVPMVPTYYLLYLCYLLSNYNSFFRLNDIAQQWSGIRTLPNPSCNPHTLLHPLSMSTASIHQRPGNERRQTSAKPLPTSPKITRSAISSLRWR